MTTREVRIPPSLRVHQPEQEEKTIPRRPPCRMSDALLAAIAKCDATHKTYLELMEAAQDFDYFSQESKDRRAAYDEYLRALVELHRVCVLERMVNR